LALEEGINCALSGSNRQEDLETASGKPTACKTMQNGKGLEGALSAIEAMMVERLD